MIEVHPNLFVGGADDEAAVRGEIDWYVISAAKEPWHRQALGYTGRAAPKDHPEYLSAVRWKRLILNLVDVDDPTYIRDEIIDKALSAIHLAIGGDSPLKTLVHCNQGISRSPTIALLYLHRFTDIFAGKSHDEAVEAFKAIYPAYASAKGMAAYAAAHWG